MCTVLLISGSLVVLAWSHTCVQTLPVLYYLWEIDLVRRRRCVIMSLAHKTTCSMSVLAVAVFWNRSAFSDHHVLSIWVLCCCLCDASSVCHLPTYYYLLKSYHSNRLIHGHVVLFVVQCVILMAIVVFNSFSRLPLVHIGLLVSMGLSAWHCACVQLTS